MYLYAKTKGLDNLSQNTNSAEPLIWVFYTHLMIFFMAKPFECCKTKWIYSMILIDF